MKFNNNYYRFKKQAHFNRQRTLLMKKKLELRQMHSGDVLKAQLGRVDSKLLQLNYYENLSHRERKCKR